MEGCGSSESRVGRGDGCLLEVTLAHHALVALDLHLHHYRDEGLLDLLYPLLGSHLAQRQILEHACIDRILSCGDNHNTHGTCSDGHDRGRSGSDPFGSEVVMFMGCTGSGEGMQ